MKRNFLKSISIFLLIVLIFCVSGCNSNENTLTNTDDSKPTVTQPHQPTAPVSSNDNSDDSVLKSLHTFNPDSDDDFAGVWHIAEGQGSQYENFVYMFDGNETATLFAGNTGYIGKYTLEKDKDGNDTFSSHLMFGINGVYTYKFNDSKTEVILSATESENNTVLTKIESFDCIPIPDSNPKIDESILGAWKSEDGEYYYFDKNGIMYQNLYNTMFTYSSYSASDGKIISTYSTGTSEESDNYSYSVKNDILTLNGFEYKKITIDQII